MSKVRVPCEFSGQKKTMELSEYLTPKPYAGDRGTIEQLQAEVEHVSASVGKLLALMVEQKALSLDDACIIAGETSYGVEVLP